MLVPPSDTPNEESPVRMSLEEARRLVETGADGTDWLALTLRTDEEIERGTADDSDAAPDLTEALRQARARQDG